MATPRESVWNVPACTAVDEWENWAYYFVMTNTVVTFVLPFTVIAVLNALIVRSVRRHAGIRRTLTNNAAGRDGRNDEKSQTQLKGSSAASVSQTKITKMLLTVSSTFLCLNLPSYAMRVWAFSQDEELPNTALLIQHICDLIFDTSFGINFFLYCASGHNFRQAVLDGIICFPRSWRATKQRLSLRRSELIGTSTKSTTSSTGSCLTPQRTTLVQIIPADSNCELQELSNGEHSQKQPKDPRDQCQTEKY